MSDKIKPRKFGIRAAVRESFINRLRPDPKPEEITFRKANHRVFIPLRICLAVALFGLLSEQMGWIKPFGLLLLFASGCLLTGIMFGFVFGMPRSSDSPLVGKGYSPNTNLENISNWLTSALIGIGLVEAEQIMNGVNRMIERIVGYCGQSDIDCPAFLLWSMLFTFVLLGFLGGYLRTRMYLPYLFLVSDAKGQLITKADQEAQDQKDRDANNLVESQLAKGGGESNVDQTALRDAIVDASEILKPKFFFLARSLRVIGEQNNNDLENMLRAAPVFEALIESDRRKNIPPRFHTNFGQLGFIYLRAGKPDYKRAISSLSEAIIVRDKQNEDGWYNYELCRAIAQIRNLSTDPEPIYKDLKVAADHGLKMFGDGPNLAAIEDLAILEKWIADNAAWLAGKPQFTMEVTGKGSLTIGGTSPAAT